MGNDAQTAYKMQLEIIDEELTFIQTTSKKIKSDIETNNASRKKLEEEHLKLKNEMKNLQNRQESTEFMKKEILKMSGENDKTISINLAAKSLNSKSFGGRDITNLKTRQNAINKKFNVSKRKLET